MVSVLTLPFKNHKGPAQGQFKFINPSIRDLHLHLTLQVFIIYNEQFGYENNFYGEF